jgi:hypothetical protein
MLEDSIFGTSAGGNDFQQGNRLPLQHHEITPLGSRMSKRRKRHLTTNQSEDEESNFSSALSLLCEMNKWVLRVSAASGRS